MGKVATLTALTAIQIACQFAAIYVGYNYWGGAGIVLGVAAANWIVYPAYAYVAYHNGLWHIKLDTILLSAAVLILIFAWPQLMLPSQIHF